MFAACVLGAPCTKMPVPLPDLFIRLRATMPSPPENVIPAPSQMLFMTRPLLDHTPTLAVMRIAQIGGVAPGTVLLTIVSFDRPVVTAESGYPGPPDLEDPAV